MRILWVKANKILPVSSGGDIRSFHLLQKLAASDELVFFSYYDGGVDPQYEAELEKQLPGCICVCTGKQRKSGIARAIDYLLRLPHAAPYAVSRFASGKVRNRLSRAISESRPDVVVCDFLDATINLPVRIPVPAVLFQHNVESEIWRRHYETATNPLKRAVFRLEFGKMLRYEGAMLARFDRVIAVSEHDQTLMSRWANPSRIDVVPTGVDLSQFRPQRYPNSGPPLVLFVGAMDWEANVDAIEHFCATSWPAILRRVPDARFRIVGRNPHARVQRLQSTFVEVTGSVPSIVDHLREASVVVVPLRIGGGTRLKIYEAMAAGRAVVSTTIGAEGLDVTQDKNILLADEPVAMTQAVIRLLEDHELRIRLGNAAAEQAAKFDWSVVAGKFREALRNSTALVPQNTTEELTAAIFSGSARE